MNMLLTEREQRYVKWYDYLWLLIPIAGLPCFVLVVTERADKDDEK